MLLSNPSLYDILPSLGHPKPLKKSELQQKAPETTPVIVGNRPYPRPSIHCLAGKFSVTFGMDSQLQRFVFKAHGSYPQQLWSSADKAIRSRFLLQQENKYPQQISLSAAVCWSAANSEISSICT
ncbi:hypothetical protein L1987_15508 [Smallanthus sonchifolius]|uniref:Uncharacterized protein n=1 Tax=Smallanthus sonchifolius TaxID=185202 RepID=A0ACB9J8F1_9ASTR|nr:hypothetical protein L1987_15508 [Smallanthus sonchifolius]